MYRPDSRKWWRGIKLQYRRVDKAPGWQKGRKSGGSWSRQLLSWRVPISIIPESAITGLKMKSPDVDSGDLVIGDRQSKHIAEMKVVQIMKAAGETTGKVYEGTLTR